MITKLDIIGARFNLISKDGQKIFAGDVIARLPKKQPNKRCSGG